MLQPDSHQRRPIKERVRTTLMTGPIIQARKDNQLRWALRTVCHSSRQAILAAFLLGNIPVALIECRAQHCVANMPTADKSWCYRTFGWSVSALWLKPGPFFTSTLEDHVQETESHLAHCTLPHFMKALEKKFVMTNKIWLQPNWYFMSDLSCSLTIFFLKEKSKACYFAL